MKHKLVTTEVARYYWECQRQRIQEINICYKTHTHTHNLKYFRRDDFQQSMKKKKNNNNKQQNNI